MKLLCISLSTTEAVAGRMGSECLKMARLEIKMKNKLVTIICSLVILTQLAGGVAYYKLESSKPEYVKNVSVWSSLEGEASSRVPVDKKNPVVKQKFVNQYDELSGFVLFFYNCLETDSGEVYTRIKDNRDTVYFEYRFEPQFMETDTFCLVSSPEEGILLTAGETYYIEISVENMDEEDHIEIGTTCDPSRHVVFEEPKNGETFFVRLDYTYTDTETIVDTLKTAAWICLSVDVLLLLACLWFVVKRRKLVLALVLIGIVGWITYVSVCGYLDSQKWYSQYSYMVHAMGTIDGKTYTNSRDAFELSYAGGHRVFEVDFSMTADGKIVCWHDWGPHLGLSDFKTGPVPTLSEFKELRIWGKYTTMDLEDLLDLMIAYPDIYVVTDSKFGKYTDAADQFSQIAEMLEHYSEQERRSIIKRLIVQIYNDDMYEAVKRVLPVENYIYTLYQRIVALYEAGLKDMDALCTFCVENEIPVVTLPYSFWTEEIHEILKSYGLEVWVHEINELPGMGIDGVYTDVSDLSTLPRSAD